MEPSTIHPDTTIASVHLTVRDLGRTAAFYAERLGFALHRRGAESAALGAGGPDLLVLVGSPGAPRVRGTAGLYHLAVLLPSRRDLGRAVAHLLAARTPLAGASDHGVSEAIYLADPEGNGIEIYRDRPRAEWPREGGELRMTTDSLDLEGLVGEAGARGGNTGALPSATRIGHVHLHVADLEAAERFYVGVLGFERTARLGRSALFVAAGGYHHHIGLNTWAGEGAPAPPPGAAGLRLFVVQLPDASERDRVLARARGAGASVEETEEGPTLVDPSSNRLVLAAGG